MGAPSFPTISPGGCGIVAALGGVLPFGGCVAFAGGFAGPGVREGVCSLLPSGEETGLLAGGFTSLGAGACVVGVWTESAFGATGSTASVLAAIPRQARITPAIVLFDAIG